MNENDDEDENDWGKWGTIEEGIKTRIAGKMYVFSCLLPSPLVLVVVVLVLALGF